MTKVIKHNWALWLLMIAVCALGIGLRVWQLPLQLLADDEWHAIHKLLTSDTWGIFTSFGHADHSIPLTLYYYWLSHVTPLTENSLRLPMLLAGIITPFCIPYLARDFLSRQERGIVFITLSLSPILIYFSRTARPYAISTVLAAAAVLTFSKWTKEFKLKYAATYLVCTSLSAWLQPVTLTLTLTPFLFYGIKSIYLICARRETTLLWHVLILGIMQVVALLLLLGPPILFNLSDISGKTGIDAPTLYSTAEALKLLTGSSHTWFLLVFFGITTYGFFRLLRKEKELSLLLISCCSLSFIAISLSGATWIQHALVTARYYLPALLLISIFFSVGSQGIIGHITTQNLYQLLIIGALPIALIISGPIPRQYNHSINQFTGHMGYQFDYDWKNNEYNKLLTQIELSKLYSTLGEYPEKTLKIVVAPWLMEWHYNTWYLDQLTHKQIITAGFLTGFCGGNFRGEYPKGNKTISLNNAMHVSTLIKEGATSLPYDYFIYHKNVSRGKRDLDIYHECLDKIRIKFGRPFYEDQQLIAYKLKG